MELITPVPVVLNVPPVPILHGAHTVLSDVVRALNAVEAVFVEVSVTVLPEMLHAVFVEQFSVTTPPPNEPMSEPPF